MARFHIITNSTGETTQIPFTSQEETEADAAEATSATENNRVTAIKSDAGRVDLLNRLKTATPAQIDTWLSNNVTSIATARAVLAAIIKVIALDARQ